MNLPFYLLADFFFRINLSFRSWDKESLHKFAVHGELTLADGEGSCDNSPQDTLLLA